MALDARQLLLATLLAVAGRAHEASPAATEPSVLSGRWFLNVLKSDDAQEKLHSAMSAVHSADGFRRDRRGGSGGRPESGERTGPIPAAMRALLEPAEGLTITNEGSEISVLDQHGHLRTLSPDGRTRTTDAGGTEIKTRWHKQRLIVETTRADGLRLTETFSVAADRSQLSVVIRVEAQFVVSVRRLYEQARE